MPNAVDITEIPEYTGYAAAYKSFIRQRVTEFQHCFYRHLLNQARTSLPGITIYEPDFFTLLDNVLTNAAAYGLTNALSNGGVLMRLRPSLTNLSMNGPGTNYIFWDEMDPTAKFHAVMADVAQQLISPVRITNLTLLNGSNRLDVANMPIGLNGFVDGSTNLVLTNWVTQANFNSTNATQAIFVPVSGPLWFYRLRFPYAWSWP